MWIAFALALVAQEPVTAADAALKARRIGVASLEVHNVDAAVASVVEEALLVELRKLARTSVIGWGEIKQMLDIEATKQTLGCGVDGACLAEIADAAGVDLFVAGTLTMTSTESVFTLTRIDQKEARVVGKVQKRLQPQRGEEWLAAIGPAVEELFPDVGLRPGATRGVATRLALRLNPPPLPSWTPWVVGATSVGFAIGAVAAGAMWAVQQADYRALVETKGVAGSLVVDKGNLAIGSEVALWTLSGLTLLGAGATAATIPFTNFNEDDTAAAGGAP